MKNDRQWFKVWVTILDDITLNQLSAENERVFWRVMALCASLGDQDVINLSLADIAWRLHMSPRKTRAAISDLADAGLLELGESVRVTNWKRYQPEKTDADRKRDSRAVRSRTSHGQVTDRARDTSAECPTLERRKKSETGQEPDTRATVLPTVRSSASSNGSAARAIPTDDKIRAHLEAYNRGAKQSLTFKGKAIMSAERLCSTLGDPAVTERAAAFYAKSLSGGVVPSLSRFADDADEWRSRMGAPKAGSRAAPKCAKHPRGAWLNGRGCLDCEEAAERAEEAST